MPTRRAAAIALALARELQHAEDRGAPLGEVGAADVTVHADGSIQVRPPDGAVTAGRVGSDGSGAAIGRVFFSLLVGRAPLDRTDAYEPALTAALPPSVCALIARSSSDADGQWPTVAEWSTALVDLAGGQATGPSPAQRSRARTRRALIGLGVAILVLVTLLVVVQAPGWWDAANEGGDPSTTTTQP